MNSGPKGENRKKYKTRQKKAQKMSQQMQKMQDLQDTNTRGRLPGCHCPGQIFPAPLPSEASQPECCLSVLGGSVGVGLL